MDLPAAARKADTLFALGSGQIMCSLHLVRVRLDSVRPACVDSRDMLGRVVTRGLEGPRRYPLRRHPPRWHPTVRLRGRLESSYPAIPMAHRDLPRWPRARGRVAERVAPGAPGRPGATTARRRGRP